MDKEDFPSDSDESDEDFRPEGVESDVPSEDQSGSCNTDDNNEEAPTSRKTKTRKRRKQKVKTPIVPPQESDEDHKSDKEPDEEAEKKRADALWADFLNDTDTPKPAKHNGVTTKKSSTVVSSASASKESPSKPKSPEKKPEKVEITEIFDFAGEEVRVTKEVDATQASTTKDLAEPIISTRKLSHSKGPTKRFGGGLNSILGQINKKNKITVLEKTKLDWDHFKKAEGLNEDLQTFNKGKDGYLEKQDFLQRTDVRQFEIEKNLRQVKRSNR